MHQKAVLDFADATVAITAALAKASQVGLQVCIAIVDDSGTPIQLSRMDGVSAATVEGSIGKARSSALTGADTKLLEAMIKERPALATMARVAVEGGLPLFYKGERVGGIGVSGAQSHQDAEIAHAGVEALVANWTGRP